MTGPRVATFIALLFSFTGCAHWEMQEDTGSGMSDEVRRSERASVESMTMSRLGALERSVNDFIQTERRIPERLSDLIPKYLASIPEATLGLREHQDANRVTYYPASLILDGQVNGSKLKDTGGWGYVHNDHQVIIFVNCVHKRMSGSLWYQARGVY